MTGLKIFIALGIGALTFGVLGTPGCRNQPKASNIEALASQDTSSTEIPNSLIQKSLSIPNRPAAEVMVM